MKKGLAAIIIIIGVMLSNIAYCEEKADIAFVGFRTLSDSRYVSRLFEKEEPKFKDIFERKCFFYLAKAHKESYFKNLKDRFWTDLEKEARDDAKKDLAKFFEPFIVQIKSQNEQLSVQLQDQKNNFFTKSQNIINVVEKYERKILEIDKQIYALKSCKIVGKKISSGIVSEFIYVPPYSFLERKIAKELMKNYSKEYKNGYVQWKCKIDDENQKLEAQTKQLDSYKCIDKDTLNKINNKMQECIEEYRQKSLELVQLKSSININLEQLTTLTESQLQKFNQQYSPPTYSKDIRNIVINEEKKYIELALEVKRNHDNIDKLHKFAVNTPEYLKLLDEEFENETSLNKKDISCMFVITGLQLVRQYLLTKFPQRLSDKEAAKAVKGNKKESSERHHQYYNPSLQEIINSPVPFDANIGSNGVLKGGGEFNHRGKTLGHDPLLGYIFGTANIVTSTLTTSDFNSYHIRTANKRDIFAEKASTIKVLNETFNKLFNEGMEGRTKVAYSLLKEWEHLQSDKDSKVSLPAPGLSVSPETASWLANMGMDYSNLYVVGKQASYTAAINMLSAMVHSMLYDKSIPENLYKVKTKKVIMYSNLVASSVNAAVVLGTRNVKILDVGGIAVAIYELITSPSFIRKVKRDFIFGTYDKTLAEL